MTGDFFFWSVMRDSTGDVVSSGRCRLGEALEAFHAELIALMVKQAAMSPSFDQSLTSGLVWEMKEVLPHNFRNVSGLHVSTISNLVGHGIGLNAWGSNLNQGTGLVA